MRNEVETITRQLGGKPALGCSITSETELHEAIRQGFPHRVVRKLMEAADLTIAELAASLDLSARSLQRRHHAGRLASYESDRLYRLARAVALAKLYVGDDAAAIRWLKRPNRALGGAVPLDLMDTEAGARAVENVLGRIAYGGVS